MSRDKKSGETVLIKIPKNIIEIENIANVELKLEELIEKQSKFYTFNKYIKPEYLRSIHMLKDLKNN